MTTASPQERADGRGPTHPVRAARGTLAPGPAGRPAPSSPVGGAGPRSSARPSERQAARTPGPETAAPPPLGRPAVRAGAQDPDGGALEGARGVPAGTTGRTFTIALPAGMKLLSLNDRLHYGARYRRSEALKEAAWAMARYAKIPRLERVSVVVEYQPRDRRERDPDNISPSGKAALDGLVAAKVIPDDSKTYVAGVTCTIGDPYPLGRLVLHLTELPPLVAAGGAA